ncbi:MAG: hypothetical protein H6R10_2520 [Rhodocyclaceae bacterium]|nr:hypothetical protein [Rhodocyclaceae bacterium]
MRNLAILLFSLVAAGAAADTTALVDPTRPAGVSASAGTSEGAQGEWRLQSVLSPRGGRPTAIINGMVVRLGEKIGESRLVRLSETEAVLQGPKGTERLPLTPEVSKLYEMGNAAAVGNGKRKKP